MDEIIFNSYLNLIKKSDESTFKKISRLPTWFWIIISISCIGLLANIVSIFCPQEIRNWLIPIALLIELFSLLLLIFLTEKHQINRSNELLENYIERCGDIYDWLKKLNLQEKEEIQALYFDIEERVKFIENKRIAKNNSRDKWIQILIIPIGMACFGVAISTKISIEQMMTYALSFAFILAFVYFFWGIINSVTEFFNIRKSQQMRYFMDDLKGILYTQFKNKN